jgi:ABC-type sulfate transport system substrate-binding protein
MTKKAAVWSALRVCAVAGALGGMYLISMSTSALADTTLLNVSYDVARELYKEINPTFVAEWKAKTGEMASVNQSHGGSSRQAQEIIVKHGFRPRDEKVLKKHAGRFPAIRTFNVEQTLGSWAEVQKKRFAEGGIYDQIAVKR